MHQLGGREHMAIKLKTPAICLVKIDDDFVMLCVTLLDGRKTTIYQ
jgi:hypothetical protein